MTTKNTIKAEAFNNIETAINESATADIVTKMREIDRKQQRVDELVEEMANLAADIKDIETKTAEKLKAYGKM